MAIKEPKLIGRVTHYYGNLGVAIVEFSKPVEVGVTVRFKGTHTDFAQTIDSMQYEHAPIDKAKKGQQVGIKVTEKVHEGNEVYLEE
ncbi:MAG: hypothetical protein AAB601_02425 [Patescibacteria group bacterium]